MTQLTSLHAGLERARHLRTIVRIGSATCVFASAVMWALLLAFGLDVMTSMSRLERAILLLALIPALVWVFRKWMLPALRTWESDVQLALVVERKQGISSDLVAAMQFEDTARAQYGSPELRAAVIDYTAEAAYDLDFLEGFSRKQLSRRAIFASSTLVFLLAIIATFPAHTGAFLNRLMLGGARYPTDTVIRQVLVHAPGEARPTHGRALVFDVELDPESVLPETGIVHLRSATSGVSSTLQLDRLDADGSRYRGQLDRVLDDLTYQVKAGDDTTDWRRVKLLMPPSVQVKMDVQTPSYAASRLADAESTRRGRAVLQGSRVEPIVTADKPLRSATLTIEETDIPLVKEGETFVLAEGQDALDAVDRTMQWKLQVVDEDGLSLLSPLTGVIQVRPDQPPRIGAAAVTPYVLPNATPSVEFEAADDFALESVTMLISVVRAGEDLPTETPSESVAGSAAGATTEPIVVASPAGRVDQLRDRRIVELSPLNLQKGDRVIVTLEALDHRGRAPGLTARSQPVVFQVTDRQGIQTAMSALDEQMQQRVDEIIKAQLGQGVQP